MMWTQIENLYEYAKTKYKLKLHCGQSGMSNSTSWVYLAEDIQNISFLESGELIITTGLFTQSGVTLYDFIRSLTLCNCSGILINVGQYLHLEDITPEIISFCNLNGFPLITMPWEIHLVDIMQDFCIMFLREKQKEDNLSSAFQSAIYQVKMPEKILRVLNQHGFSTQTPYFVLVIRNLNDPTRITSPLNSHGLKYHLFQHDNLYVLIYDSTQEQFSLNEMIQIICFCDSITLGASDAVPSLEKIGMAYKRARFSLAAAEFWKRSFVRFDELGVFQLMFCVPNTNILQAHYQRFLGSLEKYDQDHDSDYLNTLWVFLQSDCNLLKTAAQMHTHRNTVVYRIRKIKDLLNSELDSTTIKFNLMLAFYIKEYFSM